jgi:hypothetical protein
MFSVLTTFQKSAACIAMLAAFVVAGTAYGAPPKFLRPKPKPQSTSRPPAPKTSIRSKVMKLFRPNPQKVSQWHQNKLIKSKTEIGNLQPTVSRLAGMAEARKQESTQLRFNRELAIRGTHALLEQRKAIPKSYNIFSSKFRTTRQQRSLLLTEAKVQTGYVKSLSSQLNVLNRQEAQVRAKLKPLQSKLAYHQNRKTHFEKVIAANGPRANYGKVPQPGQSAEMATSPYQSLKLLPRNSQYQTLTLLPRTSSASNTYDRVSVRGGQYDSADSQMPAAAGPAFRGGMSRRYDTVPPRYDTVPQGSGPARPQYTPGPVPVTRGPSSVNSPYQSAGSPL